MDFETREVIGNSSFVDTADQILASCNNADLSLTDSVEGAQKILSRIGDIAEGRLTVEPPLSEEQITHYSTSATTIVTIGNKALSALENTPVTRGRRFGGSGSSAKT